MMVGNWPPPLEYRNGLKTDADHDCVNPPLHRPYHTCPNLGHRLGAIHGREKGHNRRIALVHGVLGGGRRWDEGVVAFVAGMSHSRHKRVISWRTRQFFPSRFPNALFVLPPLRDGITKRKNNGADAD
jgi:hypothetical protein